MKPEVTVLCSKDSSTNTCLQSAESSPQLHIPIF